MEETEIIRGKKTYGSVIALCILITLIGLIVAIAIRNSRAWGDGDAVAGMMEGRKEGMAQGMAEGRAEGKLQEKYEIAKKMLKEKMTVECIMLVTGLTKEEIEKLKK